MKKTHQNLTEKELENVINNMVDKTIIECRQRTVPDFTDGTVLVEQTQGTDEMLHKHSPKRMKETQLQYERYKVTDKV